jgi:hypothetical protein
MLIAHWGHEKLQWPTMDPFAVIENDQLEQDQLGQMVPRIRGKDISIAARNIPQLNNTMSTFSAFITSNRLEHQR